VKPRPLKQYVISEHARLQMAWRGLPEEVVEDVLRRPEQSVAVRPGRVVQQRRYRTGKYGQYLVRVFVDVDRKPPEVVTAYRTSRVSKYWKETP
jgi:hypothetical protein